MTLPPAGGPWARSASPPPAPAPAPAADADAGPPPVPAPKVSADGSFHTPCEACGADLRFAPGQRRLLCAHCGHAQEIAAPADDAPASIRELDLARGLAADLPQAEMAETRASRCPNCGALVEFAPDTHSAQCPFCATPVVVGTGAARAIKPQALIPFRVTEDAARAALGAWLKGRWFAPNGLSDYARRGRRMTGVYTPFWTFDARTRSRYSGQRGDAYYVTVTVQTKDGPQSRQERRIRWTPVSGQVARDFDDVLILAATSLPRRHTDALEPWNLDALTPYRPEYLSGFLAEGYTVSLAEGRDRGHEVMAGVIARDVRADIGGDEQRIGAIETRHMDETFKHVLLPVWTAAYRFRGKSFRFVVNGQTGKVDGERPWSAWKIGLAVAGAIVVAAALYVLSQHR